MSKVGRNAPCPCGSGKKFKKCCQQRDLAEARVTTRIATGYRHMMEARAPNACDRWWDVWAVLRRRLTPDMRTTDDAQVIYPDINSHIHDWAQDFAQELGNAARRRPEYAKQGVQFCREILEQFPDEEELFRQNFRADLGELCLLAGEIDEGERQLEALIRDYPDKSIGYVRFCHALIFEHDRTKDPHKLERALELLQQAKQHPVVDGDDYDLDIQLADLIADVQQPKVKTAATERATGAANS